ncbi:MAG: NAD(+)/NADH kinase, partial [Pyramidobacter sp.]|nr:NAD(+)/NADH kinase [Pyramidobacter sp.]
MPFAVGILVNPVAGMGGSVGLKGSDGAETLRCARERGAVPRAAEKMARALAAALPGADARFLTAGGPMGEEVLAACGLPYKAVYSPAGETTGEDTVRAVRAMRDSGAELIVFAGGDGTARDVCAALGDEEIPVLGVPAGVKIHSAVYAVTPERAGQLLSRIVSGEAR